MAQTRSQRKKSGVKRQPVVERRRAVAQAEQLVATDVPALDPYVDRKGFKPIPGRPDTPIKQTSSWGLWPHSLLLWVENKYTATTLLILPISVLVLDFVITRDAEFASLRNIIGVLCLFLIVIWLILNVPAVLYMQTLAVRGEHPTPWQCYRRSLRFIPRLIGLAIIFSVMFVGGLALLVIPGLFVFQRYALSVYYMIDLDVGIREAMQRSSDDSKGMAGAIWGVYLIYGFIFVSSGLVLARIFPPYGALLSSLMIGLYIFGPALRYREVGMRLPASEAVTD